MNEELTLDQIHYQSDAVYWNASASKAMLQAADKYQSIVKQQYDIIQDRFDDGMISRTDLLMISTRLKEAELQYIKARQNYTLALQQAEYSDGRSAEYSCRQPVQHRNDLRSCPDTASGRCFATTCRLCQYGSKHHEEPGTT